MAQQGVKPNINAALSCGIVWLNFMFDVFCLSPEGLGAAE